jgi:4-amino-4-deoxy-L-arabinose transferase-like glycosyltransferase
MQARPRIRALALAVTALALLVRGLFSLYTPVIDPLRADAGQYAMYGYNLARHGVFSGQYPAEHPQPDGYRSPGYPVLVAAALKLVGTNGYYALLLAINALLGALTCGLVVLLGARFLPLWGAALAGLLLAFSPHHISLGNYVLSETLFGFALTGCLYLLARGLDSRRAATLLGAGVVSAVAWATNPVFALFPPLAAGMMIWREPGLARSALMFLLPLVLATGAWQIRNWINVPADGRTAQTRALDNFIIGSHPEFTAQYRANPRDPANAANLDIAAVAGSWAQYLGLLTPRLQADPARYAHWYLIEKPHLLWDWNLLVGHGDIYVYAVKASYYDKSAPMRLSYDLMRVLHPVVLLLALAGLPLAWWRRRADSPAIGLVYLALGYVSLVYVVLQAEARYSVPLRPLLYLAAVYAVVTVGRLWAGRTLNPAR